MQRAPGQIVEPPWRPHATLRCCRATKRRQYCSLACTSYAKWTSPTTNDTDGVFAVRDALQATLLSMMAIDEAKNEFVFNRNVRLSVLSTP
jgi:hypothetical protein